MLDSFEWNDVLWKFVDDFFSMFYLSPKKMNEKFTSLQDLPDDLQAAIPFFVLFIIAEFLYYRVRNIDIYETKDTVMSLSLGLCQLLFGVWIQPLRTIPYQLVYEYCQPIHLRHQFPWIESNNPLRFIITMIVCDFCYYLFHRFSHQYHFLWIPHSVHHSGERYNFATALRQGMLQLLFLWVFYIPMAVLGIHVTDYMRHDRLNVVYQFWVHTELIDRFPYIIECIMNTPSHHRMHHRPNLNCNFGGVLIIWDRIFSTFVPEYSKTEMIFETYRSNLEITRHRRIYYGLAYENLKQNYSPLTCNLNHAIKLFKISKEKYPRYSTLKLWIQVIREYILKCRWQKPWNLNFNIFSDVPIVNSQTLFSMRNMVFIPFSYLLGNRREIYFQSSDVTVIEKRSQRETIDVSLSIVYYVYFLFMFVFSLVVLSLTVIYLENSIEYKSEVLISLGILVIISIVSLDIIPRLFY